LRTPVREHYPNPIRSDTSRRESAATPAGESDVAGLLRHAEATRVAAPVRERHLTIPPHEPHPREG